MEIIQSKSISLIKTRCWDDTYENFLLRAIPNVGGAPFDLNQYQERYFGICWTTLRESDALWRIYSHYKRGVRIRSTISTLAQCIQQGFNKSMAHRAKLGKVQYNSKQEIERYFNNRYTTDDFLQGNSDLIMDSMFMKRNEFAHEQEIRIILDLKVSTLSDFLFLPITVLDVIEEITFDPRISDKAFNRFHSELQAIGFEKIINKSDLYSPVRLNIRLPWSSDLSKRGGWLP